MARRWSKIILHHSATDDDAYADDWKAIERFHTSFRNGDRIMDQQEIERYKADLRAWRASRARGDMAKPKGWGWNNVIWPWRAIGYHAGIEKVNGVHQFQLGRSLDEIGAHCKGQNLDAIGFMFCGNFDEDRVDDAMYFNAASWVGHVMSAQPWITLRNIHKHSEFAPKSCPGALFDLDRFLYYVKVQMGGR
ncbi:MAG: N-acetylmuramoyl-L-alanine amidase [Syntrophaceae bacterium PtaB.Bin038]|nr:MAG: N-acetylmuramoyl-L-alanine amidase [Syntrophaceae bacterium PtaB.Bin038]